MFISGFLQQFYVVGKFVARKTWSQWVCLTDDLIKILPVELKNKKKFANGGLKRPGFQLSPSLKKSWKKILKGRWG